MPSCGVLLTYTAVVKKDDMHVCSHLGLGESEYVGILCFDVIFETL